MTSLTWARILLASTLGLHIIYAVVGIGLPLLVAVAHGLGLRRHDDRYLILAQSLTRLMVLLFALGAATGMVISFELSLVWSRFMAVAGPVVAAAFAVELVAFFLEGIFLALYVYGRTRIRNAWLHWACLLPIIVGAVASGILITLINGWMQVPAGFQLVHGVSTHVDPVVALFRRSTMIEVAHVALTAYLTTAGLVASVAALGVVLRRGRQGQAQLALGVALIVAAAAAIPSIVSGDLQAKALGQDQPEKLAVAEALFRTQADAPVTILGIVVSDRQQVGYAIQIPGLLSLLEHDRADATVIGLDHFPRATWPPVALHYAFDVMVGSGFLVLAIAFGGVAYLWRRRRLPTGGPLIVGSLLLGPLTVVALESGWTLTEIGRQPWIIYHVMLTQDGVTQAGGIPAISAGFLVLWALIAVGTVFLVRRLLQAEQLPAAVPANRVQAS